MISTAGTRPSSSSAGQRVLLPSPPVLLLRAAETPTAAATVRRSDRPAMNCMLGSNCCETTASSTAASCTRICCCWYGGKTSMIRSMDCAALAVCNVAKTRWPVSAMVSAAEMVSRSRISPTMMTLGSSRSTARSALGKV